MNEAFAIKSTKADISPSTVVYITNPQLVPNQTKGILLITKLKLNLENCYGIKKLKQEMDFAGQRVIAIYAPNGSMKTSLAQTFVDLSEEKPSKDRYFPLRTSKREIKDQNDKDVTKEMIFAVNPYDEEFEQSEEISVLLVDNDKRKELEKLFKGVNSIKADFLSALKTLSQSKKELEKEISSAFMKSDNDFYGALFRAEIELPNQKDDLSDIPYDRIFDDNIKTFLEGRDIQASIKEYIEKYNELLASSTYFKKGVFNYYDAAQIAKQLTDHGFFEASHYITLNAAEKRVIKTKEELEKVIEEEKQKILNDRELRKRYEGIQTKLTKNAGLREFGEFISNTEKLLPHLNNLPKLKEDIWKSYFKTTIDSFNRLVESYRHVQKRQMEIEAAALEQQTLWEKAIDTFNSRFHVPFKLEAKNKIQVMLAQAKTLTLDFTFIDNGESVHVSREDLLMGLSNGERRAFYILNIIFEVERRRKLGQETIFVIDDIADSFDYKNKYAIVEYLQEISEINHFYQIILTHNFDFFRTIQSRYVRYDHCYMAYKSKTQIDLKKAEGIRNPFILDWKAHFHTDTKKRIASIPFMRNIVEYTKGMDDPDYKKLTSLVHWKNDTANITDGELVEIFNRWFNATSASPQGNAKVYGLIDTEMKNCLGAPEGVNFENKIVLSIAIRLKIEKFMIEKIHDPGATSTIKSDQTMELAKIYKKKFVSDQNNIRIIDKVILMTPENIHLNSFMYEPILDMSDEHLKTLCNDVCGLG